MFIKKSCFRFIAERGEGGQLRHIEKIDEAFNLKALPSAPGDKPAPPKLTVEKPLQITSQTPRYGTLSFPSSPENL